jgi:hypothetical protein
VRHNVEGLSVVFPPAYLLSFVTDHATEPLHDPPDLALYFRSRMTGALGLCFKVEEMEDSDQKQMAQEIGIPRRDIRSAVSRRRPARNGQRRGPHGKWG